MKAKKELKDPNNIFIISVTDITSKNVNVRNAKGKRYLVETNVDSYKFDEDIIIKYYLFKDKEFSKEQFDEVLYNAKISEGFNKALKYLSRFKKTTFEVKEYLRGKNEYSEKQIEEVIEKLKQLKFLDDLEYAYSYMNTYQDQKGPLYIRQKLELKRIHKDIIDKVLNEYSNQFCTAFKIANKLLENDSISKYPINKQKNKIYSKLISSGFNSDVASSVISKLEYIDNSESELEKDIIKQIKRFSNKTLSEKELKLKIVKNLMNKGYSYQNINRKLNNINVNEILD